ncbi:hypothetical protein ACS0TY_036886 [Phlomoides rotata]
MSLFFWLGVYKFVVTSIIFLWGLEEKVKLNELEEKVKLCESNESRILYEDRVQSQGPARSKVVFLYLFASCASRRGVAHDPTASAKIRVRSSIFNKVPHALAIASRMAGCQYSKGRSDMRTQTCAKEMQRPRLQGPVPSFEDSITILKEGKSNGIEPLIERNQFQIPCYVPHLIQFFLQIES